MAKNDSTPNSFQLPLPIEGVTTKIYLTKGYVTIVDALDIDLLIVKWKVTNRRGKVYATRSSRKPCISLHRVILARILGRDLLKSELCDHINGNSLDNRRSNLRLATQSQNNFNSRLNIRNTSGYKGVTWSKQRSKWQAQISVNKTYINLGHYDTPQEAYEAYKEAARKYHGEFANFD